MPLHASKARQIGYLGGFTCRRANRSGYRRGSRTTSWSCRTASVLPPTDSQPALGEPSEPSAPPACADCFVVLVPSPAPQPAQVGASLPFAALQQRPLAWALPEGHAWQRQQSHAAASATKVTSMQQPCICPSCRCAVLTLSMVACSASTPPHAELHCQSCIVAPDLGPTKDERLQGSAVPGLPPTLLLVEGLLIIGAVLERLQPAHAAVAGW